MADYFGVNKVLVAIALAAGLIPAAMLPPHGYPMQIQMPSQTVQGQTKTPPAKAWPGSTTPGRKTTATAPASGTKAGAPQGGSSAQDKQIEEVIHAKLAKSKIGKDGFTVRVQGGVAFWEGSTSVVQHKGSATRMAKSAGAKSVVNNIKVSDAAKLKASENLDQGRRRAQVKRSDARTQQ
jgi:hypothetical protein